MQCYVVLCYIVDLEDASWKSEGWDSRPARDDGWKSEAGPEGARDYSILLCHSILYYLVLHYTILHLNNTHSILHHIITCTLILYYIIFYYITLHYILLYYARPICARAGARAVRACTVVTPILYMRRQMPILYETCTHVACTFVHIHTYLYIMPYHHI